MKRAALGIRMHSGWGVLVAVSGDADSLQVIDRRRIVTTDPGTPGAKQPYHYAAGIKLSKRGPSELGLPESERYLANCAAVCERLASAAVGEVVRELDGYRIVGCAAACENSRGASADSYRGRRILSQCGQESLRRFENSCDGISRARTR